MTKGGSDDNLAHVPGRVTRVTVSAGAVLLIGLLAAPFVFHHYDVVDCFLTWARASGGRRPWDIYLTRFRTDCDYPPVVPFLLTAVERMRLWVGAGEVSGAAIVLVKLPNMLAAAAHAPLAEAGLRRAYGTDAARRVGMLLALSPVLFVNAALWGQFDTLLSFFLLAAMVALLHERPAWAGAALGAGLATKLLAVVAVPLAVVWTWRRCRARGALALLTAAAAVILLVTLPYVIAGAGGPVRAAYGGAVDFYPFRTVEAYNGWYLLDRFDIFVRGMAARDARLDTREAFGGVTFRQLGLAALAAYTAALLWMVARRPTRTALVWAMAAQFFAFFMLPTQMHQRYVLPAAILAALLAPLSKRGAVLCALLAITGTLNQALDLGRAVLEQSLIADPLSVGEGPGWRAAIRLAATGVAVVHVLAFAWMSAILPREASAETPIDAAR